MHFRALVVLCLAGLMTACSSDKPKNEPVPATPAPKTVKKAPALGPLPAYQREISGSLQDVPAGAEVELA
ncbi:hypothetical protein ACNPOQ_26650, partial [Pseudomonas shirazensis]